MGRVIGFLFLLVVILFGLSFALLNAQAVELDYYFSAVTLPLSLVLVMAIIIGAVLGVLAATGVILRQRREIARLRRHVGTRGKDGNETRKLPLKDATA